MTTAKSLGSKSFSSEDVLKFSEHSGDRNPIHVDPIYSRRSLAGGPIVHGVHLVLWALEEALTNGLDLRVPAGISVRFVQPVLVGTQVALKVEPLQHSGEVRLGIYSPEGSLMVSVHFLQGVEVQMPEIEDNHNDSPSRLTREPRRLDWQAILSSGGEWESVSLNPSLTRASWPGVSSSCGYHFVELLIGLSRLVGMECPGLNSLFREFRLQRHENFEVADWPSTYLVKNSDERFNLIELSIQTPLYAGELSVFMRPEPTQAPPMSAVLERTVPGSLAGERALIVGGSRGIGAVTAKALAASGAEVCITYASGEKDANEVLDDILSNGMVASGLQLNVLESAPQLSMIFHVFKPTVLYYFATPFIFGGRRDVFSEELVQTFRAYYCSAFETVVRDAFQAGIRLIWHPSSTVLDSPRLEMREYALAKAEQELLAGTLMAQLPGLVISCPRLPRTATDQTNTIFRASNSSPVDVVLSYLMPEG